MTSSLWLGYSFVNYIPETVFGKLCDQVNKYSILKEYPQCYFQLNIISES